VRAFAYPSHGYTPLTCLLTAEGRDIIEALGQLWHELQGIDGLTLTFKTAMGINQEYRLPGRLNLTAAIAKFAFCP
jgi:hypothetical protein